MLNTCQLAIKKSTKTPIPIKIIMNCPFCNAELEDCGAWGYLASHQSGEILGHTFKCPNSNGFEDEDSVNLYLSEQGSTPKDNGVDTWDELTCPSSLHHVTGSFYTDKLGNLHEGYPC